MKKLLGILVLGLLSIILIGCNEKSSKIKIEKVLLFGDSLMSGYGLKENAERTGLEKDASGLRCLGGSYRESVPYETDLVPNPC